MKSRFVTIALMAAGFLAAGLGGAAEVPARAEAADPAPSPSPDATTWALRPATENGPDDRVSLRHVIEGGDEVTDMVALTNFGDRPATFAVYTADGIVAEDGNFNLIPSDQESTGGGAWMTVPVVAGAAPRDGGGLVLEVPAASTVMLPVEIRVPGNATPGDHPAGIVAELVDDGEGVRFASRIGVRLHLRVPGDVIAELVPKIVTTSYRPAWNPFSRGTMTVEYEVTNEGNVRLGAESVGSVAGPWGAAPVRTEVSHREVLPGQAATATVEIPVAPLFLTWGDITVTPAVVGTDVVDAPLNASTSEFRAWTVPWAQLLLVILLVGAFLLVRAHRRRSAARIQAKIAAAVEAARESPPDDADPDGS